MNKMIVLDKELRYLVCNKKIIFDMHKIKLWKGTCLSLPYILIVLTNQVANLCCKNINNSYVDFAINVFIAIIVVVLTYLIFWVLAIIIYKIKFGNTPDGNTGGRFKQSGDGTMIDD